MKRQNRKWITLMLAGLLCTATASVATLETTASADEATATTVALSSVFAGSAVDTAQKDGAAKFTFSSDKTEAYIKSDLAFHWYEGKNDAKYLTVKFSLSNLDFEEIDFEVQSATSVVNEDDKSVNAVEFKVKEGKLYANVRHGAEKEAEDDDEPELGEEKPIEAYEANQEITVALKAGEAFDSFGVDVIVGEAATYIGEFKEIGENYSDYSSNGRSLTVTGKQKKDATTTTDVVLNSINGQSFALTDGKITDTAAPVLVVNEDLNGYQFGTAWALNYAKVDIISSNLTEVKTYYQYNPTDTKDEYEKALFARLNDQANSAKKTISTSVYFMDTVYYKDATGNLSKTAKDGYTATTVMQENDGKEFVAIRFTLSDGTFKDATAKVYDLSWYANNTQEMTLGTGDKAVTADYIVIDQNDEGATYKGITATYNAETKEDNAYVDEAAFTAAVEKYQAALQEEAKDVNAGSGASLNLPDVDWLIADNGGYRNLKFTISYKKPSSSSPSTSSSLSYSGLKISTTEAGMYEFKIFATDKAGNPMQYYLDGELVDVSTGNIWDIEKIPSFTFTVVGTGLTATKPGKVMETKVLDQTYTFSTLTVKGATNQQSKYALYKWDSSKAKATISDSDLEAALKDVSYTTLRDNAKKEFEKDTFDGDYFKEYASTYLELVAADLGVEVSKIENCLVAIDEYNEKITEDDAEWATNKYQWNSSSRSFKTVEDGYFIMFADYWEKELPMQRAAAFKIVEVEGKQDSTPGDNPVLTWIKNNVVSVILFGVAAVMLILIIVLLLVKPSDETLEDVDAKVAAKKAKKEETKDEE